MQIRHDIHNHTLLSLCCYDPEATIEAYVRRAAELGHTVFGISNHLWDEKVPGASDWYHKQMINYGLEARNSVPADTCGVKVLIGVESEYFAMHDRLGMLAETGARFDYVLIPHTHTHMKGNVCPDPDDVVTRRAALAARLRESLPFLTGEQAMKMARTMSPADLAANFYADPVDLPRFYADQIVKSFGTLMANPEFIKLARAVPTSIAHPFHPCGLDNKTRKAAVRTVSDDDLRRSFTEARSLGVGIEINTACYDATNDYADEPLIHVMQIALSCGCKFTFGTDSHTLADLGTIRKGDRISELIGITEADLMEITK